MGIGLRGDYKSSICLWCSGSFNYKSDKYVELAATYDNEPICKKCIKDYMLAELQRLKDYLKTTAKDDPYGNYPSIREELLAIKKLEYQVQVLKPLK